MKRILAVVVLLTAGAARPDAAVIGYAQGGDAPMIPYLRAVAARSGLELQERRLLSDAEVIAAVARREVDVAIAPAELAIDARARGMPVVLVAGVSASRARLLARKELEIDRVAGLEHRRVGVQRGGAEEMLLLSELRAASLSWSTERSADVQLVYLPTADLNTALRSRYVDAIVQREPLATRALRDGAVELPRTTPPRLEALVTSEQVYGERRLLGRIVRCLVDGARLVEHSSAFERLLWATPPPSEPLLVESLSSAYVDDTARWMREFGVGAIPAAAPARELVRLDLLAEVAGPAL
ncbi:MAG TPA: ABC transporter substrate-binding protein [Anaeromyxobacteraceae bacterium]|nr:ABC transporter substrate-binding protein [Anaeromyxobacteraceae bacterium]